MFRNKNLKREIFMYTIRSFISYAVCAALLVLSGCASYKSLPLRRLAATQVKAIQKKEKLLFAHRVYNKADSERYLGRNILAAGYQPIQLTITNQTRRNLLFSLNNISLPCVNQEAVKNLVYTSTTARALGYGIPALFIWPFIVPAVVDSIWSSDANKQLDVDYNTKSSEEQTLKPGETLNGVIFVPLCEFRNTFTITLLDVENSEKVELRASPENAA
jgi:hypothetical protein